MILRRMLLCSTADFYSVLMKHVLFLLVVILAISACGSETPQSGIRMGLAQAPITLDPRYASDAASERVNRLIYRALVGFDAHNHAIPDLATWHQVDDLHYQFSLGVTGRVFHDGSTLSAQDVVATYLSQIALKDSPHQAEFINITEVKALDTNHILFALKLPDANFPAKLILGIMPQAQITRHHDFAHHPIGSGPLKLLAWRHALQFERVLDHQSVSLEEVRDPTVRLLKLMRGELNLIQGDLSPEMVAYLKTRPHISVQSSIGTNYSYLGFNLQDPLLKDIRIRRAIAMAIDRDALIHFALVTGTRPATAILPPEHWARNNTLASIPYDPVRAKKLLQEAGVKLPLTLTLKTSTDAQRVRLATILQSQLQAAGIKLEIRSLDWGTFFEDVKQGHFQLYGLTWVGIKTPEIYKLAFHSQSIPPKGANRGRLEDAALDAMLDQQNWKAATARIQELLPVVPLWYEGQFAAMRDEIMGYTPSPDGNWDSLATVSLVESGH